MSIVLGRSIERSVTFELKVILHEHAVMHHGDIGGRLQVSRVIESWGGPENVVRIPLAWWPVRVHCGWRLFVDRSGLSIKVGFVLVRVEDLDFVSVHHKYATVSSTLPSAFRWKWC